MLFQTFRGLLLGAALLTVAGCTIIDDHEAQIEYEKLRQRPISPHGDRVLPAFDSAPASDEDLPSA